MKIIIIYITAQFIISVGMFQVYKVVVDYGGRTYFIFRRYNEFHHLYERVSERTPDNPNSLLSFKYVEILLRGM